MCMSIYNIYIHIQSMTATIRYLYKLIHTYICKGAECYVGGVVSYDPAVDNSDSPSIVEQLQQGHSSDCYTFISDCP